MIGNIISIVIGVIIAPKKTWIKIRKKKVEQTAFMSDFLFPFFGIAAISAFIHGLFLREDGSLQLALKETVINVTALFGGFYISSYAIKYLLQRFDKIKSLYTVEQFVGYNAVLLYILFVIVTLMPHYYWLWLILLYMYFPIRISADVFLEIDEKDVTKTSLASFFIISLPPLLLSFLFYMLVH